MHICRLWFHVEGIGCPSGQPTSAAPALVSRTFLPKPDERFDQFIHRVNKRLESDRLGGERTLVQCWLLGVGGALSRTKMMHQSMAPSSGVRATTLVWALPTIELALAKVFSWNPKYYIVKVTATFETNNNTVSVSYLKSSTLHSYITCGTFDNADKSISGRIW